MQRIDVTANEFGLAQRRLSHIQFGSRDDTSIILHRAFTRTKAVEPAILATDTDRPFADFLRLQGLPPDYDLPSTVTEKKRAIGNAVPSPSLVLSPRPSPTASSWQCELVRLQLRSRSHTTRNQSQRRL
ncbi:MAG: hypothetical protein IPL78_21370 [Chloroflexi bacterium]|nr:hypothetical protein [Chloroflexota bacterium]